MLEEVKLIAIHKEITKNQTNTTEFLNCSFWLINGIMHRSTAREMYRRGISKVPFEHISIDENSFKKGYRYITVISHPKVVL